MSRLDLSDQIFGRLTALTVSGRTKKRDVLWACSCSCGARTLVAATSLQAGHTRSCGCLQREHRDRLREGSRATRFERFWSKVDQSCGPYACWPWTAARRSSGYGIVKAGVAVGAHVVALSFASPRPRGAHALHHCDNPPCCNPLHLYWGSDHDNVGDRERRGRSGRLLRRGLRNVNAIDLTGQTFGRLLVIEEAPLEPDSPHGRGVFWRCQCACGAVCLKRGSYLRGGDTVSCGCRALEIPGLHPSCRRAPRSVAHVEMQRAEASR